MKDKSILLRIDMPHNPPQITMVWYCGFAFDALATGHTGQAFIKATTVMFAKVRGRGGMPVFVEWRQNKLFPGAKTA